MTINQAQVCEDKTIPLRFSRNSPKTKLKAQSNELALTMGTPLNAKKEKQKRISVKKNEQSSQAFGGSCTNEHQFHMPSINRITTRGNLTMNDVIFSER